MNSHLKGSLLIVLGMFLFSLQTVLIRYVSLSTFALITYIFIFLIILLSLYMLLRKESFSLPTSMPLALLYSLLGFVNVFSFFSAMRLTSLANVMFSHYTSPIFALIFSVIFLKEKFEWKSLTAIAISLIGIYLLFNPSSLAQENIKGILLGLTSGVAMGGMIILNRLMVNDNGIYRTLLYQILPLAAIGSLFLREIPAPIDLGFILFMAACSNVAAPLVYLEGQKTLKAQHVGIIAYVEIIFVVAMGYFFFNEIPSSWLGGLLIVGSGVWIIWDESKSSV